MVRFLWSGIFALSITLFLSPQAHSQADYKRFYDEEQLPAQHARFQQGDYHAVIQYSRMEEQKNQPSPVWRTLRMKSHFALGQYEEATLAADLVASQFPKHLPSLLEVQEIYRQTGNEEARKEVLEKVNKAAANFPIKDRTSLDRVHLGQAALLLGADPAEVLRNYYGPAKNVKKRGKKAPPGLVEAHQAAGELALQKSDFKLAADEFRAALKYEPNHPELRFGLARAYLPDNRKAAMAEIDKVLENFPFHFASILEKTESAINSEQFDKASEFLQLILGVNPNHPKAWALIAVIAELERNDDTFFDECRKKALEAWQTNPEIDHLIGRVLSRNYRFTEGALSQKRAIAFDPNYLPAKLQLAIDYLRLGKEELAWPLAREVAAADQYNVLAYNLEILEEEIASFVTIKSDNFTIRMPRNEAKLYGDRALELLEEAHDLLTTKYEIDLEEPTLIEFFPNQADFAIRTFGSLGGQGLLGVCFGSVVTMNSPGSLANGKNNWEATLWHEFAHVITLTKTANKMPRWLSEGISVYEEMEKQSNWGQRMSKNYRKMILEKGELTPISKLSSAFSNAPSGEHIMFAYYESMLVVRFIVDNYGFDALKNILSDLANGTLINVAIEKHTTEMATLEEDFDTYAKQLASAMGPGVDWNDPDPAQVDPRSPISVSSFLKKNPNSFWAHQTQVRHYIETKQWQQAVEAADRLIKLFPDYVDGLSNGYALKAAAYRGMGDTTNEAETLRVLSSKSAEAYTAYSKLLTLDLESKNWSEVVLTAERAMAINPFLKSIHYCQGCACAELGQPDQAIVAFEKLLKLSPNNTPEVRYRLANLYNKKDTSVAKRHVLDALADAPRYRDAHRLLLELEEAKVSLTSEEKRSNAFLDRLFKNKAKIESRE